LTVRERRHADDGRVQGVRSPLGKFWKWHFWVQHGAGEFAREGTHTSTAKSFNATLKRGHTGVYHYMSPKRLLRYVSEAALRWNGRKAKAMVRLASVLRNGAARRLSYKTLIA
jgi:hypothetical protein